MNGTHLHLLLNHFPIIGTLVACGLMAWALAKNNSQLKNITAVLIIIMAVFAFVADQTGEQAEHALKGYPGISRATIHEHEEAAEPAMAAHMLAALLCAGFLWTDRRKLPAAKNIFIACFAVSIIAWGLMARAGYLGGQIRHTELNSSAPAPAMDDTNEHD